MKVKICGITSLEDALRAAEAGADLLGYNFYPPSPRCITTEQCRRIQAGLQDRSVHVLTVGVFVNASPEAIAAVMEDCCLELAQLSGDEPPEHLEALEERAFKALRPASLQAAQEALQRYAWRKNPPAALVDAFRPGQYGGTGHTSDWNLARSLAAQAPILLAGGLTTQNVAAAVRRVQPWGVDVASGVESAPGRKDTNKMLAFIQAAHQPVEETEQEVD